MRRGILADTSAVVAATVFDSSATSVSGVPASGGVTGFEDERPTLAGGAAGTTQIPETAPDDRYTVILLKIDSRNIMF